MQGAAFQQYGKAQLLSNSLIHTPSFLLAGCLTKCSSGRVLTAWCMQPKLRLLHPAEERPIQRHDKVDLLAF